jgi:heme oxygenase
MSAAAIHEKPALAFHPAANEFPMLDDERLAARKDFVMSANKRDRLTREQRTAMARAWRDGVPAETLAERYGVHAAYVRAAAARMGIRKGYRRYG